MNQGLQSGHCAVHSRRNDQLYDHAITFSKTMVQRQKRQAPLTFTSWSHPPMVLSPVPSSGRAMEPWSRPFLRSPTMPCSRTVRTHALSPPQAPSNGCVYQGRTIQACSERSSTDRRARFDLARSDVGVPSNRRYVPGTMVVATTWQTRTGWLSVRDFLAVGPWHHTADRSSLHRRTPGDFDARHALVRLVTCLDGTVDVGLSCEPSFEYGSLDASWAYEGPGYYRAVTTNSECPKLTLSGRSQSGIGRTRRQGSSSPVEGRVMLCRPQLGRPGTI